MPPVFNRFTPNPHPYDQALDYWSKHGEKTKLGCDSAAMCRNIQWDSRVSPDREVKFALYSARHALDGPGLKRALEEYFKEEIRKKEYPGFLDPVTNGVNIVHGGQDNVDGFALGRELVNILDLNNLGPEYDKAKNEGTSEFEDFDAAFDGVQRLAWLDSKLDGKQEWEQRAFIRLVLNRLAKSRKTEAFQPVWVTFWDDFEPYYNEGPDRWCEVIGVPKSLDHVWLVVLRYTVSDACTLVRPAQLDGGWFGHHFPSPPDRPPQEGGCAMDLRLGSSSTPHNGLLSEFIHPQIDFEERFIQKVGRTTRATVGDSRVLRSRRKQHRVPLGRRYAIAKWMPKVT